MADEAEFDIVNDVEKGLFGRVKSEARIRARVRPRQPASKEERRARSNGGGRNRSRQRKKGSGGQTRNGNQNQGGNRNNSGSNNGGQGGNAKANNGGNQAKKSKNNRNGGKPQQGNNQRGQQANKKPNKGKETAAATVAAGTASGKKDNVEATISREDQEKIATEFLEGVLSTFDMTGSVSVVEEGADDDAIEMSVTGEELGLLVGQKGNTLSALQELTRTVVQRNSDGAKTDRLRVDVAGYRARRAAALREFAQKLATEVVDTGTEKLLEPMGAADRKVVHDAITEIDGVETGSEGEEPRRRVVIRPTS